SAPGAGLPYGQIPWWTAGGKALIETAAGHREALLTGTAAEDNVAQTEGTAALDATGEAIVRFTRAHKGQSGYPQRSTLGALSEKARHESLNGDCGSSPGFDLSEAALTAAGSPADAFAYR